MLRVNQLSGFGAGKSHSPVTTLSQVLSATSTGSTVVVPSGVVAGDMLVLLDYAVGSISIPTAVVPAGFTSINTNSDLIKARQVVSVKIADGTEAGATLTGTGTDGGGTLVGKILVVFRTDSTALILTTSTPNSQGTSGNPTAQNVVASGGVAPLVVIACYGADAAISPRTFTPAKDGEIGSSNPFFAWKIYNTSPADVSVDMDDEGSNNILQSFFMHVA